MMKNKSFDFIKNLKVFVIISAVFFLVGIIACFVWGPKLDITFKGGTVITYSYTGKIDTKQVDEVVSKAISTDVTVSTSSGVSDESQKFAVSLADNKSLSTKKIDAMNEALEKAFSDNNIVQAEVNSVNASVGTVFFLKCLVAVLIAAVLVIIYVAIRFRKIGGVSAAVTALIALIHDVLIAFFASVIFGLSIDANFIAVVMTLLGYSLNDTIVVFDRIRENRRVFGNKKPIDELVNISNNQVLSRNIMTSLSTVIAIVIVYVVCQFSGITSLNSLTVPLIFGLIAGSYSSICIAPTIWAIWQNAKIKKEAAAKK